MGLLAIVVVILVAFFLLELFKHKFTKNIFRYFIVGLIFLVLLMFLASFFDLSNFFSPDNTFAKTGSVIAEDVQQDIENIEWEDLNIIDTAEKKTKDFLRDILES